MKDYVIHPDKCSLLSFVLGSVDSSKKSSAANAKLYKYLLCIGEKVCLTTPEMDNYLLKKVRENPMKREQRRSSMNRIDRIRTITDARILDEARYAKNLHDVREFFEEYIKKYAKENINSGINMDLVAPMFRDVIKDVVFNNSEKIFMKKQIGEDAKMLAKTLTNKEDGKRNFFLSLDGHFSDPSISEAINQRFGVKAEYPGYILSEIAKSEHLSYGSPIFQYVGR